MAVTFICYPRCTTCQKAQKWLDEKRIVYETRDIKTQNPGADELRSWIRQSALPARRFFNTSGMRYRALSLAARMDAMSDDEKIALLATDGLLVKRPLLIAGETVLVGFRPEEWAGALGVS